MQDRLLWLLERFELNAKVVQAGPLADGVTYARREGLGYLHVLQAGRVQIRDESAAPRMLTEPSAILYLSPTAHRVEPQGKDTSMVCAAFEFGLGTGNPLTRAMPEAVTLALADLPSLAATLAQLFTEAAESHCGRQAVLDRLMEVALVLILRDLMDRHRLEVGLLAGLADPRLAKAINVMHAEPGDDWTLDRLARVAGMSRARFAVRFRETVGTTPGAYLGEWRLGLAQSLLLKGRSVAEVADEVGFGSASALSRSFAARCGQSPSEWRRDRRTPGGPRSPVQGR